MERQCKTIMNYASIKYCDISNGPGVRTSLFVSGCTHHCKNCFNAVTWDFSYGEPFTEEVIQKLLDSCKPHYITGLSLLGGEPMEPENQPAMLDFLRRFRAAYPDKTVWCYSGYTWEQLTGAVPARCFTPDTAKLLSMLDVLVDGEFVQDLYDISLRFRGSSNQRLINVPATLQSGVVTPWVDKPVFSTHTMESSICL